MLHEKAGGQCPPYNALVGRALPAGTAPNAIRKSHDHR